MILKRIISGTLALTMALTAITTAFASVTAIPAELTASKDGNYLTAATPDYYMTVGQIMLVPTSLSNVISRQSSNPKVISVDNKGNATAMSVGTATVTTTSSNGKSETYVINVNKESPVKTPEEYTVEMENGERSSNLGYNQYGLCSSPIYSYMYENDSKLYRVENIGEYTVVEQLNMSTKKSVQIKKIDHELPIFGGFFSGFDYNFLVYGAKNKTESDDNEVIRIVKYDKSWKRIDSVSAYGANTLTPFQSGSLRMEQSGDILYIHTCHTMYQTWDGYNHQANMTYALNISSMSFTDQFYSITDLTQTGYVSHSFNQFIKCDNKYVYRVDHGDAYPRAVSITKASYSRGITQIADFTLPVDMTYVKGYGTGVSVGGFELSDNNCLIVGDAVPVDKASQSNTVSTFSNRNIFLSVTDKGFSSSKLIWLTELGEDYEYSISTPLMVKFGYDNFLIMWEVDSVSENYEYNHVYTEMVTVNGRGELTSDIKRLDVRLSDCNPIYCSDGYVRWYYTYNSTPYCYQICPFDLPATNLLVPKKVSGFKSCDVTDNSITLSWKENSKATSYIIEQYKDNKWVVLAEIPDRSTTSYTINGLPAVTRYEFRIRADRVLMGEVLSGEYTSSLVVYTKSKPITGFKVKSKTDNEVILSWNRNSSVSGYIIEQYKGNKWVRVSKLTDNSSTSVRINGLASSTRYAFRIQGYNNIPGGAVKSVYSGKLVVYTSFKNMTGFKASSKTSSTIDLCWAKNDTVTGYILEQYKDNKWVRIAKIINNDITTCSITGLSASTRYAFRIQAYKETGNGAIKSAYTPKLIVYTNPDDMTGFKVISRSDSTITLSWKENSTVTGYIIEQYKGNKWVRIAKIENNRNLSYRVTRLKANTRYAFRIQGYKNIPGGALRTAFTSKLVVYTYD